MTYSIVARDPETGDLGVAVQTCMFAVGAVVPWARPGVGAVATQAIGEPAYGWRCLDALASGMRAPDALAAARASDPGAPLRQVGVIDATGTADAFTGELCIDHAGHHVGDGYAVQANMMASAAVWPAMAEAFEHARGDLADRLVAALYAAEDAGGDARGRMSAALLVVDGKPNDDGGAMPKIDLRVDDNPQPLDELSRLARAAAAFRGFGAASNALMSGQAEDALREIDAALVILPDDENLRFLRAGALVFCGRIDEAGAIARELVAGRASWATIVRSFATKGLLPVPPDVDIDSMLQP
jgi:uncharacterized Ntn-hydrolase superfamily protein